MNGNCSNMFQNVATAEFGPPLALNHLLICIHSDITLSFYLSISGLYLSNIPISPLPLVCSSILRLLFLHCMSKHSLISGRQSLDAIDKITEAEIHILSQSLFHCLLLSFSFMGSLMVNPVFPIITLWAVN